MHLQRIILRRGDVKAMFALNSFGEADVAFG